MGNGNLKKHVEGKIFKGYMIIGNLSQEEFTLIDDFCKGNFEDNRRQMLLNLIRYYDGDTSVRLLDDKLLLIYEDLNNRIDRLEGLVIPPEQEVLVKKENIWKGLKHD